MPSNLKIAYVINVLLLSKEVMKKMTVAIGNKTLMMINISVVILKHHVLKITINAIKVIFI